jgi:tetratricopeptide (TPR) repeat protein
MLDRAPTRNTEAYALYLQARELIDRTKDSNRRAEELLRRAIALDDRFALGYAALGETYAVRGARWWGGPREMAALARPLAERALELEPDLVDAHLVLAMLHRLTAEPQKMLQAIDRVLALDPDHPEALEWAGWSYLSLGRPEQAVGLLERVTAAHPDRYLAASHLSMCYEMLGRVEDAERAARLAFERQVEHVRRSPERGSAHARVLMGISLIRFGQIPEGLAQVGQALALEPDDNRMRYNTACAYARAGQRERALHELREGVKDVPHYIGDWPRYDLDLASLHDHPEFIRMFGKAEKR